MITIKFDAYHFVNDQDEFVRQGQPQTKFNNQDYQRPNHRKIL